MNQVLFDPDFVKFVIQLASVHFESISSVSVVAQDLSLEQSQICTLLLFFGFLGQCSANWLFCFKYSGVCFLLG